MARYSWLIAALISVSIGVISILSFFDINVSQVISELLKREGSFEFIVALIASMASVISVFSSFKAAVHKKEIDRRKSEEIDRRKSDD